MQRERGIHQTLHAEVRHQIETLCAHLLPAALTTTEVEGVLRNLAGASGASHDGRAGDTTSLVDPIPLDVHRGEQGMSSTRLDVARERVEKLAAPPLVPRRQEDIRAASATKVCFLLHRPARTLA